MECRHAYAIPRGDLLFCLHCKKWIPKPHEEEEQKLQMPPRIFEITERLWTMNSPWPHIPYQLAKKHGWYISLLGLQEYLVMPIWKDGNPIYYSARKLGNATQGCKYLYPKGVKKSYWISNSALEGNPIIICEGVADAVYCSLIGPSIGLLGSYYNGSLDSLLANRHVAICLDGDAPGIFAAMHLKQQLKTPKSTKIVVLPNKFDPTDLPVDELRKRICA